MEKEKLKEIVKREFDYKPLGSRSKYTIEDIKESLVESLHQALNMSGVSPRFLAIGCLSSGKSFRYEDSAKDLKCFIDYVTTCYPSFEIEAVVNVG